jgi:hypothetical protein
VQAAGFFVDVAWIGRDEARRRVLAAWRPDARVWGRGTLLAVVWPEPVRMQADDAPGALLVPLRGAFSSVPLSQGELEAVAPPPGTIVLARGGDLYPEPLGEEIDPSTWLDVRALEHERSSPLSAPAVQAISLAERASEESVGRAFRATQGEPAPGRADVARALAEAVEGRNAARGAQARSHSPAFLAALGSVVLGLFTAFAAPLGLARGSPARGAKSSAALTVRDAPPPSTFDAWLTRVARVVRHLVAQTLLRLRLARFIGRAHAEYIAKLLDFFERGDLENALRHAIPLGGPGGEDAGPALLPPRPRDALELTLGRLGRGPSFGIGDLYNDLRTRYRAAFERLDRAGQIDHAAFVLAELLRASGEAVAYLEKHRRFALAAALAEARGLPPELGVRLWFRAGDRPRAIALARRHGCFALAVERLERDDAEAARALRLYWADACARAGDYVAAIAVAREIASAQRLVAHWIERALEVGGVSAATASVFKLEMDPAAFADVRARMEALLVDASPLAQPARQAFLTALSVSTAPAAAALARAAVRAVVTDPHAAPRPLLEDLVAKAADPSLRVHALGAPTIKRPTIPPGPWDASPTLYLREGADGSAVAIADAAVVAHGRLLVALGELGVRLVGQNGATLARFDAPASAFVVSPSGDRALAAMARHDTLEVARIDVIQRRVQRWGLLDVQAFARAFDGATWFVARGSEILALDATADDFHAMWSTRMEGDARIVELHWSDRRLVAIGIALGPPASIVVEVFELPAATLRQRRTIENAVGGLGSIAQAEGRFGYYGLDATRGFLPTLLCRDPPPLEYAHVELTEGSWCVRGLSDGRSVIRVGRRADGVACETARCVIEGPALARLQESVAVVFDTAGRVLVLHANDGSLLTELRLRV